MKKLRLLIIMAVFAGIFMCLLAACTSGGGVIVEDPSKPYENVVAVKVDSVRNTYYLGESINFSDYKVKLELKSGEVKEEYLSSVNTTVDSDYVDSVGMYFYKLGETSFTVRYGAASTVYTVNVVEPKVVSLALKSAPNKLEYIEGESLNMDGCKLELTLDTANKIIVFVSTGFCSGFDSTTLGVKTVKISYFGKTVETNVSIRAKRVTGVSIQTEPIVSEYVIDAGSFIAAGMTIRRDYDNGTYDVIDVTEITSQMEYEYDFSVYNPQCPVSVKYTDADTGVTYTKKVYVAVNSKTPYSVEVHQYPTNYDSIVEGADDMDYTGGLVKVKFVGEMEEIISMTSPIFTKTGFVNTVGVCRISISYLNNTSRAEWCTYMDVDVKAKAPVSMRLTNTAEVLGTSYYAGLARDVNINSLRFVISYDNGTESAEQNVSISMITEGSLSCEYYDADTMTKSITFTSGTVSAILTVPVVPVAESTVSLTAYPKNIFVKRNAAVDLSGSNLRVIYNYGDERNLSNFGVSFAYGSKETADLSTDRAPGRYTVYAYSGDCWLNLEGKYQSFTVVVTENTPDSFVSIVEYPLTDYVYGATLSFVGLKFMMDRDAVTYTYTVLSDDNSTNTVTFTNDRNAEVWSISKTDFISGGDRKVYTAGEVVLNFYGITFGYDVYVLPLQNTQIRVKDSSDSKTVYTVGEEYSPDGLVMELRKNNGTTEYITPLSWTQIADVSEISSDGWYYMASIGATAGAKIVTLIYQKADAQLTATLANVVYDSAGINKIELWKGVSMANDLGVVAAGLTPYVNSYQLRAYYTDNQYYELALSLDMLGYTTKDLTLGPREVIIEYNGLQLATTVNVQRATLSAVSIKTYPRLNYVTGEALNLTGGVLYRTYEGGALPQDEVSLSEAKITGYTLSPEFNSLASKQLQLTVEYDGLTTTFNVTVWDKTKPEVTFGSLTHFFGNNTPAEVSITKPNDIFKLPAYSLVYQQMVDGEWVDLENMPVKVGVYRVVFRSLENRYYYASDTALSYAASYELQPKSIELIATAAMKYYGDNDPALSYTTTDRLWNYAINDLGVAATGAIYSAGLTVAGVPAAAGRYPITVGTLQHPYFQIIFVSEDLVVRPKEIKVTMPTIDEMRLKKSEGAAIAQEVNFVYQYVDYNTNGGYTLRMPTETQVSVLASQFAVSYEAVVGGVGSAIAAADVKNIGEYRLTLAALGGNYSISTLSDSYSSGTAEVIKDFSIKKMLRNYFSVGRNNIYLTSNGAGGYDIKIQNFTTGLLDLTVSIDGGVTYVAVSVDGDGKGVTGLVINRPTQISFKYAETAEYEASTAATYLLQSLQEG